MLSRCVCSLTHWGRATHICVDKLTIISSDNGLSPGRRQAIIWTNAGILLIGSSGTNFSEILIEILTFSFKKMRLKVSSAKWRPFCLGLNVLKCGSMCHNWYYIVKNLTRWKPQQNCCHFADESFKCNLSNVNYTICIKILPNCVPQGPTCI